MRYSVNIAFDLANQWMEIYARLNLVEFRNSKYSGLFNSLYFISFYKYSRTTVTRTMKGNEKQFELARVRVIGVWEFTDISAIWYTVECE